MHRTGKYSQHGSIIWPVWLNGWVFFYELGGCESNIVVVTYTSDVASVSSK